MDKSKSDALKIEGGIKMDLKRKLRNWLVWMAMARLITFIVRQATGLDISDTMNELLIILFPLMVSLGVLNDPENKGDKQT